MGLFGRTSETDRKIAADTASAAAFQQQAEKDQVQAAAEATEAQRQKLESMSPFARFLYEAAKAAWEAIREPHSTTTMTLRRANSIKPSR